MISGYFLYLCFIHWVADFVCQSDWMAKNKSSNNKALGFHVLTYTIVVTIGMVLFFPISNKAIAEFAALIFISHFIIDYVTSRITKRLWESGNVHYFFVVIGFDQFLHYVCLFLLAEFALFRFYFNI